jgi:hypothetical protein
MHETVEDEDRATSAVDDDVSIAGLVSPVVLSLPP